MTTSGINNCPICYGTGQKVTMRAVRMGRALPPWEPCPACDGTGQKKAPPKAVPLIGSKLREARRKPRRAGP